MVLSMLARLEENKKVCDSIADKIPGKQIPHGQMEHQASPRNLSLKVEVSPTNGPLPNMVLTGMITS